MSCCIEGCSSKSWMEGITFHGFPSPAERRQAWIDAVRTNQENFNPGRRTQICSNHFEPQSVVTYLQGLDRKKRLISTAVPTIFPNSSLPPSSKRTRLTTSSNIPLSRLNPVVELHDIKKDLNTRFDMDDDETDQSKQGKMMKLTRGALGNKDLTHILSDALDKGEFTDVTLVCEGGEEAEAHRSVLVSASPFLRMLLIDKPDSETKIFIPDSSLEEVLNLLQLMYSGHVYLTVEAAIGVQSLCKVLQIEMGKKMSLDSTSDTTTALPTNDSDSQTDIQRIRSMFERPEASNELLSGSSGIAAGKNEVDLHDDPLDTHDRPSHPRPDSSASVRRFACTVCPMVLGSAKSLENHQDVHIKAMTLEKLSTTRVASARTPGSSTAGQKSQGFSGTEGDNDSSETEDTKPPIVYTVEKAASYCQGDPQYSVAVESIHPPLCVISAPPPLRVSNAAATKSAYNPVVRVKIEPPENKGFPIIRPDLTVIHGSVEETVEVQAVEGSDDDEEEGNVDGDRSEVSDDEGSEPERYFDTGSEKAFGSTEDEEVDRLLEGIELPVLSTPRISINSHKKTTYPCCYCSLVLPTREDRLDHLTTHGASVDCPTCEKVLMPHELRKHVLDLHVKAAKPAKQANPVAEMVEKILSGMNLPIVKTPRVGKYKTRIYPCCYCEVLCQNFQDRLDHMQDHEVHAECPECKNVYLAHELYKHVEVVHVKPQMEQERQLCVQCGGTFINLRKHISRKHHPFGRFEFPCRLCADLSFAKESELRDHSCELHPESKQNCEQCEAVIFPWEEARHARTHMPENTSDNCPLCGKFVKKLRRHIAEVHTKTMKRKQPKREDIQCQICHKVLQTQKTYQKHMLTLHDDQAGFLCGKCKQRFITQELLVEHRKEAHPVKASPCSICSAPVPVHRISKHLIDHAWAELKPQFSSENQYAYQEVQCPRCYVAFTCAYHLANHTVTHLDPQRSFSCEVCFKCFRSELRLNWHKEYKCKNPEELLEMRRRHSRNAKEKIKLKKRANPDFVPIAVSGAKRRRRGKDTDAYETAFACMVCEETFHTYDTCQEHMDLYHDEEGSVASLDYQEEIEYQEGDYQEEIEYSEEVCL